MRFVVDGESVVVEPEAVIVSGFTGNDRAEVEAHVEELRALGVPVPDELPSFWAASPSLAVQSDRIVVTHEATSGEAEAVLVVAGSDTWLTIASDHTDRAAEALDIGLAKRLCPKVIGTTAWVYEEARTRWGRLVIRSWIEENGRRTVYQEAPAATLLHPDELMDSIPFVRRPDRFLLFTGTVPAIGGIRAATTFEAELEDPVTRSALRLGYRIEVLELLEP